jgi:hypothetical protein
LKTDDWPLEDHRAAAFAMFALLAPITVTVFSRMGLYRGSWRLAAIEDFTRAFGAVLVATAAAFIARMCLAPGDMEMSLFAINGLVALVLVIGSRASYQIIDANQRRARQDGAPALIYGAGRKGASALRELLSDRPGPLRPVGFIDDDPGKFGKLINGIPVVGTLRTLEFAIRQFAARAVVVSSDAIPAMRTAEVSELCDRLGVALVQMQIRFDLRNSSGLAPESLATDQLGLAIASMGEAVSFTPAAARLAFAADQCFECGSKELHRSHVKNSLEALRKRLTQKRLYRCGACGWRGWRELNESAPYEPLLSPYLMPPLDVDPVVR